MRQSRWGNCVRQHWLVTTKRVTLAPHRERGPPGLTRGGATRLARCAVPPELSNPSRSFRASRTLGASHAAPRVAARPAARDVLRRAPQHAEVDPVGHHARHRAHELAAEPAQVRGRHRPRDGRAEHARRAGHELHGVDARPVGQRARDAHEALREGGPQAGAAAEPRAADEQSAHHQDAQAVAAAQRPREGGPARGHRTLRGRGDARPPPRRLPPPRLAPFLLPASSSSL